MREDLSQHITKNIFQCKRLEKCWRNKVVPLLVEQKPEEAFFNAVEELRKRIIELWVRIWFNDWLEKNDLVPQNELSLSQKLKFQ
jgi:hypothetical protein